MPVKTWIGSELNPLDGLFTLNEACLSEIGNAVSLIRDNPLPLFCLLYTSPSPRDYAASRMPSSA